MKRAAFSLIELLIVVLIVGIVYTIAVTNFSALKEGKVKLSLSNLKPYLDKLKKAHKAELICLDECKSCNVYVDGVLDTNASEEFEEFLDEDVKVYRYDANFGLVNLQNKVFFNSKGTQEEICFSLSMDKNGVSEQLIVEYKDKFYDFSTYFTSTKIYSSASDLSDVKEDLYQEVLR